MGEVPSASTLVLSQITNDANINHAYKTGDRVF